MGTKQMQAPWTVERDGSLCMGDQIVATAIAPDGASFEEQKANGRLCAAAPELLAALQKAVRFGGLFPDLKAEAEAVIRKALGDSAQ